MVEKNWMNEYYQLKKDFESNKKAVGVAASLLGYFCLAYFYRPEFDGDLWKNNMDEFIESCLPILRKKYPDEEIRQKEYLSAILKNEGSIERAIKIRKAVKGDSEDLFFRIEHYSQYAPPTYVAPVIEEINSMKKELSSIFK